mmetsp:Transcript_1533/g.3665  ORF Transcript_1533/g.3665 Transcript_1533/m.3665 type:complete len:391 (+) Transcript_1533:65-1237(+)
MRTGRIWRQHLPMGATPLSAASVVQHPLPRPTPATPLDLRLHRVYGSSDDKLGTLERIRLSKEDSYREQFSTRVGRPDRWRIEHRTLSSPSGSVGATVYSPPHDDGTSSSGGVCLHVHGGGWIWGDSRDQVAHRCLETADVLVAHVVSVEYALFTKPSGDGCSFDPVNDVIVALEWIEENHGKVLGAGPRFVASGESAGAHLLMLAMLRRRDRARAGEKTEESAASSSSRFPAERSEPFDERWKCLNLVYGVFDLSGTPSVVTDGDSSVPLSGNDLLFMYDMYTSRMNERLEPDVVALTARDPSLSPMYADLSRLPSSLLTVGTADALVDDTLYMATRLKSFGVDVDLAVYEGGEHGIGHFGAQEDEEMGVEARRYTLEYMKGRLWGKWS